VLLAPGDVISIPTRVFRGFENIGETTGFLFAVLGGDDPGRVTWAPHVLETARGHGLVLLENGRLIDTLRGEVAGPDEHPVTAATPEDLAAIRRFDSADLEAIVVRDGSAPASPDGPLNAPGVTEHPVIGMGAPAEPMPAGPLSWPHGFNLRRLILEPGATTARHARDEAEVLFVQAGDLVVTFREGGALSELEMTSGDTLSVPSGMSRAFASRQGADVFVVRGGDRPAAPRQGGAEI
jgi:quercetin dioxygenase-like cupin family protein